MPPIEGVNKDYLKQILADEKKLFLTSKVKFVRVPKFVEISLKTIYPLCLEDPLVKRYLPDQVSKTKYVDRAYFFNILNTVKHDYVKALLGKAQEHRN
jgi:hypothetical protein